MVWRLNERSHVKGSEQCLAHMSFIIIVNDIVVIPTLFLLWGGLRCSRAVSIHPF